MTYATIKTGPHSTAQGKMIVEGCGVCVIEMDDGTTLSGPRVSPIQVAAFIDDQDHDMTPVMHRRDF